MSDFWTNYWRQGHLSSFGDATNRNYQGGLAKGWLAFFDQYRSSQDSVVDIGTGNGALLDIAVNQGANNSCQFTGIDAAKLTIPSVLNKPNVCFLQQVKAEALPFKSASISAVVSQFGIEYSNLTDSLGECLRVLIPGGKMRFVVHSSESTIVKPNRQILAALTALRGDDSAVLRLRELLNALAKFGAHSASAEKAREALNQALAQLVKHNPKGVSGTNFPQFIKAVLNPKVKFKDRKAMMHVFIQEMNSQYQRLADLDKAALSDAQLAAVNEQLLQLGVNALSCEPVVEDAKLLGICISGEKGAA